MTIAKGLWVPFADNEVYLEHQWAEDTYVTFEREHGQEGEYVSNAASMVCQLALWCDANKLQFGEILRVAAERYSEETGRQLSY